MRLQFGYPLLEAGARKMSGSTSSCPVSELLVRWRGDDNEALGSLIPLVHAELRKLARG